MQRIVRELFNSTDSEKQTLLSEYQTLLSLIKPYLTSRIFSIFAQPKLIENGKYLAWFTENEGQAVLLSAIEDKVQKKEIEQTLATRINDFEAAMMVTKLIDNELVKAWIPRIKSTANLIYVLNNEPVIVNTFLPPVLPKPTINPLPPLAKTASHFWRWAALALAVLLLLALLAYLFLPFDKNHTDEPIAVLENKVEEVEIPKEEIIEPPPPVIENEVKAPEVEAPEVAEKPVIKVKNDPNCVMEEQLVKTTNSSKMVIVFDNSPSMLLSLLETPQSTHNYYYNRPFFATPDDYDAYEEKMTRQPNRLSTSKKSAKNNIDKIEKNIDIALVTLQSCPNSDVTSFYSFEKRKILKNKITNLTPDGNNGGTPLIDGILKASKLLDGVKRNDYMLIISDGEDSCSSQNICLIAHEIATAKPRLKINIIDITGEHLIDCVAELTGGKVFIGSNENQLNKQINNALTDMKINRKVCN